MLFELLKSIYKIYLLLYTLLKPKLIYNYMCYVLHVLCIMYYMYYVLCIIRIMYYVLCIMYYVLCIMYYVLCIMYYVLYVLSKPISYRLCYWVLSKPARIILKLM